MRDYIEIGSTPCDEECAQVGSEGYYHKAIRECQTFIEQIRREKGQEPDGARLGIRSYQHDFGTYYEVACYYDAEDPQAVDYALACEDTSPRWDAIAIERLRDIPSGIDRT